MIRTPRHTVRLVMMTLVVILAGCQDGSEQDEPSPTAGADAGTAAEPTGATAAPGAGAGLTDPERVADPGEPMPYYFPEEPADWHVVLDIVNGPATFTAVEGVTLEVLRAWISNLPAAPEGAIADGFWSDDVPPVVLSVHVLATNDSDQDIRWVRDPTLEIAETSLDAHAWVGSWLPPDTLPAGTTATAFLVYPLPQDVSIDDLTSGQGRLVGQAAFDADTSENLSEPLSLTFSWQPA